MTDDRVREARLVVGNYVEPYLGIPLADAKAVKSVRLEGTRTVVEVELGFPVGGYAQTLAANLQALLRSQPGLADAVVTVGGGSGSGGFTSSATFSGSLTGSTAGVPAGASAGLAAASSEAAGAGGLVSS